MITETTHSPKIAAALKSKQEAEKALEKAIFDELDRAAREEGYTRMVITHYGDSFYKGRWEKEPTDEITALLDLYLEEIHSGGFEALWSKKEGWN